MLVKVWTELPSGKKKGLLARVFEHKGDNMIIRYLSPTEDRDHGCTIWRYEEQTYEIDDDSVMEYLGTEDETDVGFKQVEEGFVEYSSDSEYVPSSEEESESEDVEEDAVYTESDYSVYDD
jgi:hypothetical protein